MCMCLKQKYLVIPTLSGTVLMVRVFSLSEEDFTKDMIQFFDDHDHQP